MDAAIAGPGKNNRIELIFTKTSRAMSICAACIGIMVLLGWLFNVPILKSNSAGFVTMKANAAISFILSGMSLYLILNGNTRAVKYRIGAILAGAAAFIGLLTMIEYIFNLQLGIDQLFFKDISGVAGTVLPGRMAPNTAVNFIFLGISLLLIDARNNALFAVGRALAFAAGIISFFALAGYCFGVSMFSGSRAFTKMALYTSAAFLALFLGVVFARPGRGVMTGVSADNPGGLMLRYSVPAIVGIMFLLGWIRSYGEQHGLYDSSFGNALFTIIRIIIFLVLAFIMSKFVNRLYLQRLEKEKALQEAEARYRDIKELDQLKSQFIAVISHELRTPLTIIKGFSSFLDKGMFGELNDQQKDYMGVIGYNTDRLNGIVNEMTDISRIESGMLTVEKQPCSVKKIIDSCVRDIGLLASKQGITLVSRIDPENLVMNIDRPKIEQVVVNLLNNAVKFSNPNSLIMITLRYPYSGDMPAGIMQKPDKETSYTLIAVKDSGAGIDKKNVEKIFEKFFQAEEHTTRHFQGMGLGLFIAKNIVTGHGGVIWCESEGVGKGSVFNVLLPDRS
jgi:signal transduction histidine kinase